MLNAYALSGSINRDPTKKQIAPANVNTTDRVIHVSFAAPGRATAKTAAIRKPMQPNRFMNVTHQESSPGFHARCRWQVSTKAR
jgi:hypothetical protein